VALLFSWWPRLRSFIMYHVSMSYNIMVITFTLCVYIIAPPAINPIETSTQTTGGSRNHSKISLTIGPKPGRRSIADYKQRPLTSISPQDTMMILQGNTTEMITDMPHLQHFTSVQDNMLMGKQDLLAPYGNLPSSSQRSFGSQRSLNPSRYSNPLPSFEEGGTENDDMNLEDQFDTRASEIDELRRTQETLTPIEEIHPTSPTRSIKDEDFFVSIDQSQGGFFFITNFNNTTYP